jgi:hypothetical protein
MSERSRATRLAEERRHGLNRRRRAEFLEGARSAPARRMAAGSPTRSCAGSFTGTRATCPSNEAGEATVEEVSIA